MAGCRLGEAHAGRNVQPAMPRVIRQPIRTMAWPFYCFLMQVLSCTRQKLWAMRLK